MKIYCPSYKRPDAPLFSLAKDLIIVLNKSEPEEAAEYRRLNEPRGHTVIHPDPEQKTWVGLCGTRNWILQNNNEWILMMDDDIYEVCEWNQKEKQYVQCSWDFFIEETKKIVDILSKNYKIAMAGYQYISEEMIILKNDIEIFFSKNYEKALNYKLWQAVLLNTFLLNSNNIFYDGYPNPNDETKKHGHDMYIQCDCDNKNFYRYIINNITFKSSNNNGKNSIFLPGEEKQRINLLIDEHIWLLNVFKLNIKISFFLLKALVGIHEYLKEGN